MSMTRAHIRVNIVSKSSIRHLISSGMIEHMQCAELPLSWMYGRIAEESVTFIGNFMMMED